MTSNKSGKTKCSVTDDTSKHAISIIKVNANDKFMDSLYRLANQLGSQTDMDPNLLASFKVRFRDLDTYRNNFQEAHDYLLAVSTDETFSCELEKQFNGFYDKYYSVQVLNDLISQDKPQVVNSTQVHKSSHFSLPKISLPRFSGVYTDWTNFIAMFDSLVHDNTELPNVQKMHYLLSILDKEPLNLIKHLELSDGNYLIAYSLLKDRYQNKRLIADKHLEFILNINISQNQFNNNLRKFVNTLKENLQALSVLGFNTESWSFILLHIILRKLPTDLRTKFEADHQRESLRDIPTFNNLLGFLETQLKVLEAVTGAKTTSSSTSHVATQPSTSKSFFVKLPYSCSCCQGEHSVYTCQKFNSMTPAERKQLVIDNKLCFNCLRPHSVNKCQSRSCCQVCRGRHHTKLHLGQQSSSVAHTSSTLPAPEATVSTLSSTVQPGHVYSIYSGSTILLGTAIVGIRDANNSILKVRALIDSGSQATIVTEALARKLHLPRSDPTTLFGLGEHSGQRTNGSIPCVIHSLMDQSATPLKTTALILKRITGVLPSTHISPKVIDRCRDIRLADSEFSVPGTVDILLGVELYDQIFNGRKLSLGEGFPSAYSSIFGWVLMGAAPAESSNLQQAISMSCTVDIDSILSKFWEVEEVPDKVIQDPEDILCEKHFVETHSRDSTGRFVVRLPFKTEHMSLGSTYESALKRFCGLERKLSRDARLKELYIEFMRDYLNSGHMRPISSNLCSERYYIPHHGVLKESSSTTKLRAVFDASAPSSSGVSLNQLLMAGPKLQKHVEDIILRFRTHAIVFTCDIKQMYRQVRLHEDDCKFQTIFWRESPEQPIQQFELTTVTYGVSSAAYLAMRVIHELALNADVHPAAAEALLNDTFVDDVITGASDVPSAKLLQQQLVDVLAQGGFQLRKWASNSAAVLDDYPADHLEKPLRFEDSGDNVFKVLGIEWNSISDSFIYQVSNLGSCKTKREILSNIARIYDPCGYLAPVTFYAKVIMQRVCALQLSWDDQLPDDIIGLWDSFASSFKLLKIPQIPRYILSTQPCTYEIMGFCDASESGYAAVIYLRVQHSSGEVGVHLLRGRSRVAPLRQKLTIPRLELCGALLLARLVGHYMGLLDRKISMNGVTAWCDSTIVLAWLRTPPHKLQTFEGNRVSQVQGLIPSAIWRYVPSASNPADCASRGVTAENLVGHSLWWSPFWLKDDPSTWPTSAAFEHEALPGLKPDSISSLVAVEVDPFARTFINQYSSLSRLQRITAWIFRFFQNTHSPNNKIKGVLSGQELNNSLFTIVKLVQGEVFADHIIAINKGRSLSGPLSRLDPFIDATGLLRVGGRLRHSTLPYDVKHPLILPKSHHLTILIIDHYHQLHLHAGPSILINIIRQKFWILSARRVTRDRVFQCHRCYRLKAKPLEPLMGNLPASRVRLTQPFTRVGVDFAGPFTIKTSTMRKVKTLKAYLCVYVCLTVKAVHLDVTSDLTTKAFLACFHRFVARRGLPSDVYSDCGKNFQGAVRYLNSHKIEENLSEFNIKWHMNPPYAPHMGGLWESTVKAAKQLLIRTIGEQVLTFEELSTVFARAEAVLNSRPLCPLSDDVSNLDTLTPGHFLIGQPLVSLPEEAIDNAPISPLKRWRLVQQISQHFWQRWHREYLHNLQQRVKWCKSVPNLRLGDFVLIKEDNTPPLRWRKGRISALHPGSDGVVRVVEIRTSSGSCVRSVTKVVPLPKCDEFNQN